MRKRSPAEVAQARTWHMLVCAGQLCIRCGKPAGPWGHHIIPKKWLYSNGLSAHVWDLEEGAPVCQGCHDEHESPNRRRRFTRAELGARWDRVVAWAKKLDAIYFADPQHQPVLSRLEREYPK